jgi:hypothetical protein
LSRTAVRQPFVTPPVQVDDAYSGPVKLWLSADASGHGAPVAPPELHHDG